jgi:hypothetical protein
MNEISGQQMSMDDLFPKHSQARERERERASFTLLVLRDSLFMNEWNMMTSALDG